MSDKYLKNVLNSQTLTDGSEELQTLQKHREDVEKLLLERFASPSPTIRYGGSKAKGTMIKESYDLDLICYFGNDDTSAGETLEDIYNNVRDVLQDDYSVQEKPSAIRLKGCDDQNLDFHIDVVPGRFTDDTKTDAFLYRRSTEKCRQKTNLQTHIDHVRDSGVCDAIRLTKLWRVRNGLAVRNFVLELLTIELLASRSADPLTEQLTHVFTELRDHIDDIKIEDPANPSGNDLSELFDSSLRNELAVAAGDTLEDIEKKGWESVFGSVQERSKEDRRAALRGAPSVVISAPKPWADDENA